MVIDRFRFTKKTLSDKPIGLYFAETTENIDADNFICLRCIAKRPHKDTTKTPNPNNMNTISLRLYPETEKLYKRLLDECDSGTNGRPATADQFINTLLEAFQNPRKIEVSQQSDLNRIHELETLTESLQAKVDELGEASQEVQTLKTALAQSGVLAPGQVLFSVSEAELQLMENIKPWIKEQGSEPSNENALYVLIKNNYIKRK